MEDEDNQPKGETSPPSVLSELFGSYLNVFLLICCVYMAYKILRRLLFESQSVDLPIEPSPPPMKKRDFTLQQLRVFDGRSGEGDTESPILMAVNHRVFDVTRGKDFYGPGGPYGVFAGRDASRGLATFSVENSVIPDTYDDLSDLSASELSSLKEWETQFQEKYDLVGRLLGPQEMPTQYSDASDDDVAHVGDDDNIDDVTAKKVT